MGTQSVFVGLIFGARFQVKNEVVIWDRIVRRKEDAVVNVEGKNKYMFHDLTGSFQCVLTYQVFPFFRVT